MVLVRYFLLVYFMFLSPYSNSLDPVPMRFRIWSAFFNFDPWGFGSETLLSTTFHFDRIH